MKVLCFYLRALWVALLLGGVAYQVAFAAEQSVSQNDLAEQKELLQTQIEAAKTLQQKDVDAINKRIDDQLAQVGLGVNQFGVIAGVLGVVFTVLLVLGGFIGYRNAKSEAISEAKDAVKDWIDQRTEELNKKITDLTDQLSQKASQAHQTIDATTREVEEKIAQMMQTLQEQVQKPSATQAKSEALQSALAFVDRLDEELRQTPENSYSYADWNTRAHAAYSKQQFEEAAIFWLKASQFPNAGAVNVARALFNRGVAQRKLNQLEASIATCDELTRRFGDLPEAVLREVVAEALIGKALSQGALEQPENAIATYDALIGRYGDASEARLRELVAFAWSAKGFAKLLAAKEFWVQDRERAQSVLVDTLHHFDQSIERCLWSDGVVRGRRAYVRYLQGDLQGAELDFVHALRAEKNGGHVLYDTAITDLDIDPMAEDTGMREMVERLWAAYQEEQKGSAHA